MALEELKQVLWYDDAYRRACFRGVEVETVIGEWEFGEAKHPRCGVPVWRSVRMKASSRSSFACADDVLDFLFAEGESGSVFTWGALMLSQGLFGASRSRRRT